MKFKDVQDFWERKMDERRARKAARYSPQPALHQGRFWLLHVPASATICAAIVEVYWAILFCIEATGAWDWNWSTSLGTAEPFSAEWNFAFSAHLPVLIGLVCATAPIVMLSMVWLPVQFAMRGSGRWRRGTIIAVGILANILVIVSGTVVMNYNRQDQVREALVVEQTADANRAMLQANVDGLQHELDTLMNHRSTYVATAASVGATAYEQGYVAQARATNDPRLPLLERALGAARRADDLRAQILAARQAAAQAAPAAAAQANVEDRVGVGLNTFAQYVEVYRPPFIALICTLIGILGTWWVIAMLEHMNPKDVLRSGWADAEHRIEDLRGAKVVDSEGREKTVEPMDPPRTVVTDAETGEELVKVKPHWRKLRKGKKTQVEVQVEDRGPREDERGVSADGGGRIAMSAAGPIELPEERPPEQHASADEVQQPDEAAQQQVNAPLPEVVAQEEPPELSDEEALALADELAAEESQQQADDNAQQESAAADYKPNPPDNAGAAEQQVADASEQNGEEAQDKNSENHMHNQIQQNPGRMIAAE